MGRDRIPDTALLADLRRVVRETGRCTSETYLACGRHSDGTIRRHFGTWAEARRQAGIVAVRRQASGVSRRTEDSQTSALREAKAFYAERRRIQGTRRCLRCDRPFGSTGPANRLCPQCHHAIEYEGLAGGLAC